jgi:hypothetical protein
MALQEVQVEWKTSDYSARKALNATANVVEPAFMRELGKFDAGGVGKVVITVIESLPGGEPRFTSDPPTGRDGDDVDLMTSKASLDDFIAMDIPVRRAAVLMIIHDALSELAHARGWNSEPIDRAYRELRSEPIAYFWQGKQVTSPDRRMKARPVGEIRESGAWMWVVVEDRDGHMVARSPEQHLKLPHPREFALRAAHTRWDGGGRVVVEAKGPRGLPAEYPPLVMDVSTH